MIVLLDTNVVLDVLLARQPFDLDAAKLFAAAETGRIDGFLCGTTITIIHDIATKTVGRSQTSKHLEALLDVFHIAAVTQAVIQSALSLGFHDFEDAVLHEAAATIGAEAIATRNTSDFTKGTIPIYEPAQLVAYLGL